ncbi:MAG: hypothetical protein Q9210_005333 [Variospora velana]
MSTDAFATLRPTNTLAKLAFSDLYETFTIKRQNTQEDGPPAFHRMAVEASQTFDRDVLRLRLETERKVSKNAYASDAETSESLPEPDSDMEEHYEELGKIWTGYYLLGLQSPPSIPETGYAVGKGPLENIFHDLLLCTKIFAKWHGINLRNPHARFNFFPGNRGLYISGCSKSLSAQLTVNGEEVQRRPYALNQHSMNIRLDKLEYTFQWTDYAATEDFIGERSQYVTATLGGPLEVDFDMPTPLPNRRTMGRWTLGDALGAGGHGRVLLGTNPLGEVAAIKMLERTSKNHGIVDAEVRVCNEVTAFAEKSDDGGRILRVVEVLYSKDEKFSSKAAFDNVAVVLLPMTPQTLADICGVKYKGQVSPVPRQSRVEAAANARADRGSKGMTMEAAVAFRDALTGLQLMHNGGWMHRDLKPTNIGLVGIPARAVLLDVDTSAHLRHGTTMKPNPGGVGTVGYLAPELELVDYDHSIDIWAMGIILYHLTYNHHPWRFALNPWRNSKDNEKLRPQFRTSYQEAINKMTKDYSIARQSPTKGYIHLGSLFVDMGSAQLCMLAQIIPCHMTPPPEPLPRAPLLAKLPPSKQLHKTKSPPAVLYRSRPGSRGRRHGQSGTANRESAKAFNLSFKLQMGHHQLTEARLCQNRLDIVATQGEYLVPRAGTPVFEKAYDDEFAAVLARKLKALTIVQIVRRVMYRQAADEWPIGHTPPEVKERRRAELRALEELEGAASNEGRDSDEDNDATTDGRTGSEKGQAAPGRAFRTQPQEACWLPTPPLSVHSHVPTPHGRKRRRVSTRDEEEERPRKTYDTSIARVDSLEEDIPNGSQGKGRKRRRADDADDEGERNRERPNKARKTVAQVSRRRQTHQSIRSRAG